MRLNKYLSEHGICSRREADRLIQEGKVSVNDKIVTLGAQVSEKDRIIVNGKLVGEKEKPIFIAFNKPKGIVCTSEIRDGYTNIYEYLKLENRVFTIGRLDKDSQGLIILTNQGDIANQLMKSRYGHEKEYIVTVNKPIIADFLNKMSSGVEILDTVTKPCKIEKISSDSFNIILTQGLNRQIRRMCDALGYKVIKLKRIRFVNVNIGNLKVGEYRYLTKTEIEELRKVSGC